MENHGRVEIRHKAIFATAAAAAVTLLFWRFPLARYPFYPACVFRSLTGWRCPGCGSTHALAALLNGRFTEAVNDNPPTVALAPLLVACAAIQLYSALRWNRWRQIAISPLATALVLTATLLFGLLRNVV